MRFEQRLRDGITDGTVTVAFRRWRRGQVVAGHRYRTGVSMVEAESVAIVDPSAVTDADARRAGYPDAAALLADLRGDPALPLYRIAFRRLDDPDPREVLAADSALTASDVATLDQRLDRLDKASAAGPWTAATLAVIAARPGTRAADLAASLGRDTPPFKLDVRKLKTLGLTHSLEVGYRLSPRGAAYLALTRRPVSA